MSNKLMIFGKESGVTTQRGRELKVGILLLSNDENCYCRKYIKLFLVLKVQVCSKGRKFED